MIVDLFGLAQDGKTNDKGMPNLLQTALFSLEYEDVLYFTSPPRWVQKILFSLIAPAGPAAGLSRHLPRIPQPPACHCTCGTLGSSLETTPPLPQFFSRVGSQSEAPVT